MLSEETSNTMLTTVKPADENYCKIGNTSMYDKKHY